MRRCFIVLAAACVITLDSSVPASTQAELNEPPWQQFIEAASSDHGRAQAALADIGARWRNGYAAMIVDVMRFLPPPQTVLAAEGQLSPDIDRALDRRPVPQGAGWTFRRSFVRQLAQTPEPD